MTVSGNRMRLVPIALSHAVGLLCGLAGVKLSTSLVAPSAYGIFAVFVTFAPVGMWLVHAGVIKFVARRWAAAADRAAVLAAARHALVRKLPWLAALTAALAVSLAGSPWLATWPLLFATATLLSVAALAQTALQAEQRHWPDFAVAFTGSTTRSFLPPLLYAFGGGTVVALCGGFALHAAAIALAALWCLRGYGPRPGAAERIPAVYEGPLFVALAFAGWVMAGLQRWIATFFLGPVEGGNFALAANLATLIPSILGTIALQYYQPGLFAAAADSDAARRRLARTVDRVALVHAGLSLAGLAALSFVAPRLVGPLISEQYRPALEFILPAGCAMLALASGWFYHALLLAVRREAACGPVELTAAAIIAAGSLLAAAAGREWFLRWLLLSPLVPWLVNRPLALRRALAPPPVPAPAPVP